MNQTRKDIQRTRIWRYFLDAATELIESEGMKSVTIRKIADRAGYTSSTAYNYFTDLSHLKFFSALRFTKGYTDELPDYMSRGENTVEKWLYAWQCFCEHSFENPHIYSVIFIDTLGGSAQAMLEKYYTIFTEDLLALPEEIQPIIMEHSFTKRSALYIQPAVEEGFIQVEDVAIISDLTFMVWSGTMNTFINQRRNWSKEEAIRHTLYYVKEILMRYINPDMQDQLTFSL